jgi:hypothetical protein
MINLLDKSLMVIFADRSISYLYYALRQNNAIDSWNHSLVIFHLLYVMYEYSNYKLKKLYTIQFFSENVVSFGVF